jgi:hypothetical protein
VLVGGVKGGLNGINDPHTDAPEVTDYFKLLKR